MYFEITIAGFLGGVVRGLAGYIKHQFSYKNVPFRWGYFLAMSLLSGLIGLLVSLSISGTGVRFFGGEVTPALAFIIGYAGGDFVENVYKVIIKKSSLFSEN